MLQTTTARNELTSLVPVEMPGPSGLQPAAARDGTASAAPGVIYVSSPPDSEMTLRSALVTVVIAAGIALLAPLAVLLVGMPIALAVRVLLELVLWIL